MRTSFPCLSLAKKLGNPWRGWDSTASTLGLARSGGKVLARGAATMEPAHVINRAGARLNGCVFMRGRYVVKEGLPRRNVPHWWQWTGMEKAKGRSQREEWTRERSPLERPLAGAGVREGVLFSGQWRGAARKRG